jgi:hypothetical protein
VCVCVCVCVEQGGPHEHQIAAIATQFLEVMRPEFKEYIKQVCLPFSHAPCPPLHRHPRFSDVRALVSQVKANSRALAAALVAKGYTYVLLRFAFRCFLPDACCCCFCGVGCPSQHGHRWH